MMTNYDELRSSFDNILKELDEICKSIDDITDFDNYYMRRGRGASGVPTSSSPRDDRVYERYKKQFTTNLEETAPETVPEIRTKLKTSHSQKRRHRLPDDKKSTPLLDNVIGSAASFFLSSDVPPASSMATPQFGEQQLQQHRDYVNTEAIKLIEKSEPNKASSWGNERLEGELEKSPEGAQEDCYSVNASLKNVSSLLERERDRQLDQNDDQIVNEDDYLTGSEMTKIECFYSSMGCYVYVGRCIAELYQIKRGDEFDHIDSDPVDDYREFMKMKQRQLRRQSQAEGTRPAEFVSSKNNPLFSSLADDSESSDTDSSAVATQSGNVNYMYINSGVPVIVFNYGANPKRKKDLRILLAERSTGFCLWEFKFDRLTQFENSEEMTVIRLTLNQPSGQVQYPVTSTSSHHHQSIFSSVFSTNHHSNHSSSNHQPITYHNEYFERFFNAAKNQRNNHKEHLIKFVIKRDCDEFCYKLSRIMNDKRNSDLFINESLEGASSINNLNNLRVGSSRGYFYQSNQSLNSIHSSASANQAQLYNQPQSKSSVIICHFDFFNYEFNHDAASLATSFTRKEKALSMNETRQSTPFASSMYYGHYENGGPSKNGVLKPDGIPTIPKSAIKSSSRLVRQPSSSSASILPSTPSRSSTTRPTLFRNESLRSNDTSATDTGLLPKKSGFSLSEIKNLTGSVMNLGASASGKTADSTANRIKTLLVKYKKLKKSDISSPLNFNHVTHLDKPVPIGKRYKIDYC